MGKPWPKINVCRIWSCFGQVDHERRDHGSNVGSGESPNIRPEFASQGSDLGRNSGLPAPSAIAGPKSTVRGRCGHLPRHGRSRSTSLRSGHSWHGFGHTRAPLALRAETSPATGPWPQTCDLAGLAKVLNAGSHDRRNSDGSDVVQRLPRWGNQRLRSFALRSSSPRLADQHMSF